VATARAFASLRRKSGLTAGRAERRASRWATRRMSSARSRASRTLSAWAIAAATSDALGRRLVDKPTSPLVSPAEPAANSTASDVLPQPPGPVSVSSRTSLRASSSRVVASSRVRPRKAVGRAGRAPTAPEFRLLGGALTGLAWVPRGRVAPPTRPPARAT
jgi:hypothetical protein